VWRSGKVRNVSLVKQSATLFVDRVVYAVSIFLTGLLIARCYGTAGFGLYVIASAILQAMLGTISGSAEMPFSRAYLSTDNLAGRERLQRSVVFALTAAALVCALGLGIAGLVFAHPDLLQGFGVRIDAAPELSLMLWAGVVALAQMPFLIGDWRLRNSGQASLIARTRVPFVVGWFAVKAIAASNNLPLWVVFMLIGLESVILGILLTRAADRLTAPRTGKGDPEGCKIRLDTAAGHAESSGHSVSFPEALRFGLAQLVYNAFVRLNPLILASVSSVEETALYGCAQTFIFAFELLTVSVSAATFPRLMHNGVRPDDCFPQLLRLGQAYALMSVGFIVFVAVLGQPLLALVYGEAFRASYPVLMTFAFTTLFTSSALIRSLHINLSGRGELHLFHSLIALAVLIPASFVLSARYGAIGAAGAMVLACAVSGIASSFALPATRGIGRVQIRSFLPRRR
jgi:O-antigen/teichoic acid export membrane protein